MIIRSPLASYITRAKQKSTFLAKQLRLGLLVPSHRYTIYRYSIGIFASLFLVSLLSISALAAPNNDSPSTTSEDSASAGDYNLSLSTTSTINLGLRVGEADSMTVGLGNVNVVTNSPGYKLYISMGGERTDLNAASEDSTRSISGVSGTLASPAALSRATWGYAIPSTTDHLIDDNGFSESYTEMQSSIPDNTKLFATPPASTSNPELFASTNTPTSDTGDNYPIYYGVQANANTPPGKYANNVIFTALADAGTVEGITINPSTISANAATAIDITTTLYSTTDSLDTNIYLLTRAQYNSLNGSTDVESLDLDPLTCTISPTPPLSHTCNIPATESGDYNIFVKVPKYNKAYAAEFTIEEPIPNLFSIKTMQQMTPEICAVTTTPSASALLLDTDGSHAGDTDYIPTVMLSDTRDANSYTVRKLADGNCWMTDSLRLTDKTITTSDSNVSTDYYVPASSTDGWCFGASSSCIINQSLTLSSEYTDNSVYYNWYTATAGTSSGTTANSSICPKGWRLPTGSDGDFQTLYSLYNSFESLTREAGPKLVLSGLRFVNLTFGQGTEGYYWSSTAYDSSNAYYMAFNDKDIYPANINSEKSMGLTLRCVAVDVPTLIVDPSGGTWEGGTSAQSFSQKEGTTKEIENPTSPTYNISYDDNGQGATYNPSPTSVAAQFSFWWLSGGGYFSGTTYTFGPISGRLYAIYNASITLPEITKENHNCQWARSSTSDSRYDGNDTASIYGNTTFYAVCTPYPILTVNPNGGVWNGSSSTQTFIQAPNTTKTIDDPTSGPSYTITYNSNGQGASYTSASTSLSRPFKDWTKSDSGSMENSIYTFGTSDGTLTANYEPSVSFVLPEISKSGYSCGWAKGSASGEVHGPGYPIDVDSSMTFYAICVESNKIFTATTMQQFSDFTFCLGATTPSASAQYDDTTGAHVGDTNYVPTVSLRDTRNGNYYRVKKLADGRCWMTENMKLTNTTIDSSNSDLPSGKTVTIPASSTDKWCTDRTKECYDQLMAINGTDGGGDTSHPEYGTYYNWYTATATYGSYNTTTDAPQYSICPKGWKLPTGGESSDTTKDFTLLAKQYTTPALITKVDGGPGFVYSGVRNGDTFEYEALHQGKQSTIWGSNSERSNRSYAEFARSMWIGPYSVHPETITVKYMGKPIRCIAK